MVPMSTRSNPAKKPPEKPDAPRREPQGASQYSVQPNRSTSTIPPTINADEVDPDLLPTSQRTDHGAQRAGGAALASDDLADVVGVNPNVQRPHPAPVAFGNHDVVGVGDQPANQMLQRLSQHVRPSVVSDPRRQPLPPWALRPRRPCPLPAGDRALGGLVVGPARAALKRACLSAFSGCGRTPDGDVSPENFCQSPVSSGTLMTVSVGCAPTPSQY